MTTWMLMLQFILPVVGAEPPGEVHADAISSLSNLRYRGIEALFSKFQREGDELGAPIDELSSYRG
jgi:hypothetical protein